MKENLESECMNLGVFPTKTISALILLAWIFFVSNIVISYLLIQA